MIRDLYLFLLRLGVAWHWYWVDRHREDLYQDLDRAILQLCSTGVGHA